MSKLEREAVACARYADACARWATLQDNRPQQDADGYIPGIVAWSMAVHEAFELVEKYAHKTGLAPLSNTTDNQLRWRGDCGVRTSRE